jgi:hypothetical protein
MSLNSKIKWTLSICFLLSNALLSPPVQAAKYYVKPTGNDANSGLSDNLAWQHVQKGLATAVAGDTVLIRSGTYDENSPLGNWLGTVNHGFRPYNSGSAVGGYIVFKGYPGDPLPKILGRNTTADNGTEPDGRMAASLNSRSYIVFDSLHFHYGWRGIDANMTHYITIKNCVLDSMMGTYDNNGGFTSVNSAAGTDVTNITIENCDISWVGKSGGWFSENASGIHLYASSNMIFRNNHLHHVTVGVNLKQGSATRSENVSIYGNTINDVYIGVRLGGAGPFYNTVVRNNVFYNVVYQGTPGMGIGVGTPANTGWPLSSVNSQVYNNTIDCGGVGAGVVSQMGNADSLFIFNNIIYNPMRDGEYHLGIGFKNEGMTVSHVYEDYNMFYGRADHVYYAWGWGTAYTQAQWIALNLSNFYAGYATRDVEANPSFTNYAGHDYNLQAGSPALTGGRGGAWPTYRGALAPAGLTVTLTAKPACLPPGGGTDTLTWVSTNADSVVIRDQATNQRLAGSGPVNGTILTTVTAATTYVATAYKAPNTATSQVTVTVGCVPAPTVTLTANPSLLPVGGGTTTLTWTSTNADSVVIRDQNNTRITGSGPANSSTSASLTSTSTYTATAYKMPNTATAQVTVIVSISTSTDVAAPSADTSLIISRDSTIDSARQSITLRWIAPGDDADAGTAAWYDLRYDTLLITNDARFNAATQVVGEPSPKLAGSVDSMTITGLDPMKVYSFALKTGDEVPNWSAISNVAGSQNRALGRVAAVSGTYAGYTVAPLTNGVIAPRSTAATWSSDQSALPHWVEVDFGAVRPINSVQVYWAWNSAQSAWMVSRQYTVQRWNGSAYVDIVTVNNPTATDSLTVTVFPTVSTQRVRINQPANMGPLSYPTIMWQTELKIEYDTIPPPRINDLGVLP